MDDGTALVDLSYQAQAAVWPFTAISTCLFFMRLVSQLRLRKNAAGWDDAILVLSWVLDIVRAAGFQTALTSSRQVTTSNLAETVPKAAFWVIFADTSAFFSIGIPKLGIAILLVRIFAPSPGVKVAILGLAVVLNILAAVGFIITYVQCSPAAGQWDPFHYPETVCWDRSIQIIYSCTVSGLSAFTDLAFSIYPGLVIWKLKMPTWKKASTATLMGLGFASFAFAVVKLRSNSLLLGTPTVNKLLYDGIYIAIWNSIENDFVLSAACLPSIIPFIQACQTLAQSGWSGISHKIESRMGSSMNTSRQRFRVGSREEESDGVELAPSGKHMDGPNFQQSYARSLPETESL